MNADQAQQVLSMPWFLGALGAALLVGLLGLAIEAAMKRRARREQARRAAFRTHCNQVLGIVAPARSADELAPRRATRNPTNH